MFYVENRCSVDRKVYKQEINYTITYNKMTECLVIKSINNKILPLGAKAFGLLR